MAYTSTISPIKCAYLSTPNEILQDHELALCDYKVVPMVPLPPAEPPGIKTYITILRVMLHQNQDSQNNAYGKQFQWTSTPLASNLQNGHIKSKMCILITNPWSFNNSSV